ncbi:MAG: ATP-binding protein [Waddliaceae bacterium]
MFIGRKKELQRLKDLLKKKTSSLVVIRGRRRIGKSRLSQEFSKFFSRSYFFEGLAPVKGVTKDDQKSEFSNQMRQQEIPRIGGEDWSDFFLDLSKHCKKGRVLIVFDEISWMGQNDPTFLGKLKISWDQRFKNNPRLIFILSGSNSTWIEENILSSTGFFGRVSRKLKLKELPLHDCNEFWESKKNLISAYEKFKILSVTGGVPLYLEEIQSNLSAEENIRGLCFEHDGLLFNDFDEIFTTLFSHKSEIYRELAKTLVEGPATQIDITKRLKRQKGGDIGEYLDDMSNSGFISRDYTWHIKQSKLSKISRYRLSDNYLRFYLKYIEPNKKSIEEGEISSLPSSWFSILGLQFENLVLNNRKRLYQLLGLELHDIVVSGPFLQTQTKNRSGCQIDLMVQTKFRNLYVCEIKFEHREVKSSVIKETEEKINRLQLPRGFSCRPVLIHVNGISNTILESDYFSNIIDFSDFLRADSE